MLKKKKRIDEFDIAKGIAIIAMIIGHLGMKHINMIVYAFHMPLFFILSGYFLSAKDPFIHFIKKKFIGLIIPYYICAGMICLTSVISNPFVNMLHTTFQTHDITTWITAMLYGAGSQHLLSHGLIPIGGIWFLQALFIASIVVKLLDILMGRHYEYVKAMIVLLLAVTSYISAKYIWLPLNIQTGLFSTIYVYFGYFIKQHFDYQVIKEKYLMNGKVIIAFIVLFILSVFYEQGQSYLVNLSIKGGIISIIMSFFNSFLIIDISIAIQDYLNKGRRILIWYGKNSLYLLCVHIWQMDLFPNPRGIFRRAFSRWGIPHPYFLSKTTTLLFLILSATVIAYGITEAKRVQRLNFSK